MAQQKLYTEEQVREAYNEGWWNGFNEIKDAEDYTINLLTPIELPTIDDIMNEADRKAGYFYYNSGRDIFVEGCAWVVVSLMEKYEKIHNQIK